jgi:hypothetical protein
MLQLCFRSPAPPEFDRPLAKVGRFEAQGKSNGHMHALELSRFQRNIHATLFKLGIRV